jgi:DNA replication protein DnaC
MNTEQTLHQMRSLKLTGMASAYQTLLSLPYDQHPPTDQLLAELVDAEMLQRQHQKTVASIRAAKFRYQAIIEEIQYLPERNLDKNLMLRLADTAFIKRAENVFITGATGCGKSYIASALGLQACQMGLKVGYFSMTKLLQRFNLAKADNSISKELARIEKMHLIILDDWGLQPLDNPMKITLLQMIEDRHGRASTIITSQLPVAQWFDYIAEPTLADAWYNIGALYDICEQPEDAQHAYLKAKMNGLSEKFVSSGVGINPIAMQSVHYLDNSGCYINYNPDNSSVNNSNSDSSTNNQSHKSNNNSNKN